MYTNKFTEEFNILIHDVQYPILLIIHYVYAIQIKFLNKIS